VALGAAAASGAGARQLLTWAAPWWLLGLALPPLIRWLHRGGAARPALTVSRLALWQAAERPRPAGGARRPPDPAWRRRALLAALLSVALAGPQWHSSQVPITVWLDDSLHMLTREGDTTRLAAAWPALQAQLAAQGPTDVELRTLGDPWRPRGTPDAARLTAVAAQAGRLEPGPPPPALLTRERLHWLVTDGADARLLAWGEGRGPDRIVQVGRVQRNVGLQRLSARRDPDDPQQLQVLAAAINGGTAEETRELVVADDAGERGRAVRRIAPGASALLQLSIPGPASGRLRASLRPGDALAADDEMVLDLTPLRRRRVAVDAGCPAAVQAAVVSHPRLERGNAGAAEAAIDCGGLRAALPTLGLHAQQLSMPLAAPLRWSSAWPAAQRTTLDTSRLRRAGQLEAGPADAVLLAAGDEALIVRREGLPLRIDTALDFAVATAGGSESPLLLNLMLEQLLGEPLLDAVAIAERSPAASRVAAQAIAPVTGRQPQDVATNRPREATRALLLAALAVLAWEVAALAGQAARQRRSAP
jgi:hypothetical protein